MAAALELHIDARTVRLSNPHKVLYPAARWTKLDVVEYLLAISPVLLPHVAGRAVTLARFPDGVDAPWWFQSNCPPGRPEWLPSVSIRGTRGQVLRYCRLDEPAALAWAANTGALEIHPFLADAARPGLPLALVFDLDPAPPAAIPECCALALRIAALLERLGLSAVVKTSGRSGLHVFVPLDGSQAFGETKAFARAVAEHLAAETPEQVSAALPRAARAGKVLVDWRQNAPGLQTVAPYSLRGDHRSARVDPGQLERGGGRGDEAARARVRPARGPRSRLAPRRSLRRPPAAAADDGRRRPRYMNGVRRVPFRPMLARLARELPAGDWLYEPKWDGFRCVALAEGGAVDLRSRHGRPLTRYFPEVAEPIGALASRSDGLVLDGELVIRVGGEFDFQSLLARTHPAASRVARLARETPATYVAFDLLALAGRDLASAPFATRRALLEQVMERAPAGLALTPATRDVGVARRWLARYEGGGVDGVVAKALDGPYVAGKRGWVKVKPQRTADCVVAGLRLLAGGRAVGSLLLGLWDGPTLRHVGVAAAFTDAQRVALLEDLRPDVTTLGGHPWERGFGLERSPLGRLGGSAGRWDPASMTLDWTPLRPERVVEVEYDRVDEGRFRHPARFLRWRPDREARSCGFDQLGAGCATADGAGASY